MKSDQLCEKLKNEMVDLKCIISKECDDILNKIDDLLNTEVLTFDKNLMEFPEQQDDQREMSDTAIDDDNNFNFYDIE